MSFLRHRWCRLRICPREKRSQKVVLRDSKRWHLQYTLPNATQKRGPDFHERGMMASVSGRRLINGNNQKRSTPCKVCQKIALSIRLSSHNMSASASLIMCVLCFMWSVKPTSLLLKRDLTLNEVFSACCGTHVHSFHRHFLWVVVPEACCGAKIPTKTRTRFGWGFPAWGPPTGPKQLLFQTIGS